MGTISYPPGSITRDRDPGTISEPTGGSITTGSEGYLLTETEFFLLQENGSRILLE